jgi:phenylacetate-coenzyme A ligase PaaK-like adenylate-forming protein
MNNLDELFLKLQYSISKSEKDRFLLAILNDLTNYHREHCAQYSHVLENLYTSKLQLQYEDLSEFPYLPVRLFKKAGLHSLKKEEIVKTLTSSGTSSQQLSMIYLDKETSMLQTKALAAIVTSFIGKKRLPMILIDSRSVLKNRAMSSARGAGLLGMSYFGRDHFYALDENMRLDKEGLVSFLEKHGDEKILLFGFTFMVWQHFYQELKRSNEHIRFKDAILIHGGGWKTLAEQAISNDVFKAALFEQSGIRKVYNYYGMVEQVGGVYMECEEGFFHAPNFSEVLIRDYRNWQLLPTGKHGVIQTLSVLPKSYPGHSLLTEDIGTIYGVDDCPCGRKGTYFLIEERIPSAELRGCSDTHAQTISNA